MCSLKADKIFLRWPGPIYMRVGFVFVIFFIAFLGEKDLTDFCDFWLP